MPNAALTGARVAPLLGLAACLAAGPVAAQDTPRAPAGAEVVTIFPDSLPDVPRTLSELLAGHVPGLLVQRASGAAGSGSWLSFRDALAVRGGDPLIVVDGIALARGAIAWRSTYEHREPSPIDEIPVEAVERIDILRGPAAAVGYGREARRGVIIVTTRSTGRGRPTFRVSLTGGVSLPRNQFPRNDVVTGATGFPCPFISERQGSCAATGTSQHTPLLAANPFGLGDLHEAHVSTTGGGRSLGYALSASHGRVNGVFPADGEDYSRLSARVEIPYRRIGRLRLVTRAAMRGVTLPYEGDESFVRRGIAGRPRDCSPSTPCGQDTVSRGFFGRAAPDELAALGNHHRDQRFSSGAELAFEPLSGLTVRSLATHDNAGGRSRRNELQHLQSGSIRSNERAQRSTRTVLGQDVAWRGQLVGLDATTTVAVRSQHERSASTAYEVSTSNEGFVGGWWGQARSDERRLAITVEQRLAAGERASGGARLNRTQTRFERGGKPTPAFLDGGADLSLRLIRKPVGPVRQLHARGAVGVVAGYERREDLALLDHLVLGLGGLGPRLKPDRTSEWEAGIDADFGARARLALTTFGRRETHRTLFDPSPLYGSGAFPPLRRRVSGTEISADLVPIDVRGVRLRMRTSYGLVEDRVIALEPELGYGFRPYLFAALGVREGESFGGWLSAPHGYRDTDGDGLAEIEYLPFQIVGRSRPSRTALLGSELTVARSWTVGAALDYRGGHEVLDRVEAERCAFTLCAAWYDSSLAAQAYAQRPGSAPYFVPGDAIRLRELSLAFTPTGFPGLTRVSGLSVTLGARNVATWTKVRHIDPDAALPMPGMRNDALHALGYPPPRTFTARVNARF